MFMRAALKAGRNPPSSPIIRGNAMALRIIPGVRVKAPVQTADGPYRFDLSFGKVDAVPFGRPVAESRLVAIGSGPDEEGVMATL
jgi:hypothetical protein